ncbi:MAG: extracellular solute-binding protein [Ruminococcaceae bacterium]|nr:extracellular solute-binding protein [Oscillospiraceae bacterium]
MKKFVTLFLLSSMILSMAACGGTPATDVQDTTAADTTAAPVVDPDGNGREFVEDSLPDDLDFGGETITILTRVGDAAVKGEFIAEEENGDIVNDAVYARNIAVEERLNLKIETYDTDFTRHLNATDIIKKSILADSDDFDIVSHHLAQNVRLELEGMFVNLKTLPYLDFDQPWWNQAYAEMVTHNGQQYTAVGELSQTMISGTYVMFFNKTMFEELLPDEPSLYETVNNGDWTMDKMLSYTSQLYADLNGSTTADEGDRFGYFFCSEQSLGADAMLGGCNIQLVIEGDTAGEFVYNGTGARMATFFEKMTQLLFRDNNTLRTSNNNESMVKSLNDGDVMFTTWMLDAINNLRDMKDDFGIIPMPKLEATDKNYSATTHNGSSTFAIATTCDKQEAAAALLEALSAETYRKVTPAYFEVALKVKYSRDNETAQMLDLIVESIAPDIATVYGQLIGGPANWFREIMIDSAKCEAAVSRLASNEARVMNGMKSVLNKYAAMEG